VKAVNDPGCAGNGLTVTANVLATLVPQLLDAVTLMSPPCPAPPVVTVMILVFDAEVMVQPVGTVHVYEEAFGTIATE